VHPSYATKKRRLSTQDVGTYIVLPDHSVLVAVDLGQNGDYVAILSAGVSEGKQAAVVNFIGHFKRKKGYYLSSLGNNSPFPPFLLCANLFFFSVC